MKKNNDLHKRNGLAFVVTFCSKEQEDFAHLKLSTTEDQPVEPHLTARFEPMSVQFCPETRISDPKNPAWQDRFAVASNDVTFGSEYSMTKPSASKRKVNHSITCFKNEE